MSLRFGTDTASPSVGGTYSYSYGSFNGGDTRDYLNVYGKVSYTDKWSTCEGILYINGSQMWSGDMFASQNTGAYYDLPKNTTFQIGWRITSLDGDGSLQITSSIGNNSLVSKSLGNITTGTKNLNIGYLSYGIYTFIPEKSGNYSLTCPTYIAGKISPNSSDTSESGGNSDTYSLTAGVTYYVTFRNVNGSSYDATSGVATLEYLPIKTHINYVYNGTNTRKEKEGESYTLDSISSMGYTLDGWDFYGWTDTRGSAIRKYQDGETFTTIEDTTEYYLYPIWSKSYNINYKYGYLMPTIEVDQAFKYSYEVQNDAAEPLDTHTYSQTSASYTTKNLANSFTYDGRMFTLGAWYVGSTNRTLSLGASVPISEDISLNGAYSSLALSLFFDKNNERATGETINITNGRQLYNSYNQAFSQLIMSIKDCGFKLNGKSFKEWNTKADGSGVSYKPPGTITIDINTTLYAIWEDAEKPFLYINCAAAIPYIYLNGKYYKLIK